MKARRPNPDADLARLAKTYAARGDSTGFAVARILAALYLAVHADDRAALEGKHGPDTWARKYAHAKLPAGEITILGTDAKGRPTRATLAARGGTIWGSEDRRKDQIDFLRMLVGNFETWIKEQRGRERSYAPLVQGAVFTLLAAGEHVVGTPVDLAPREAAMLRAFRRAPWTGEGLARAAMRAWGWSTKAVDAAFRKV